MTVKTEKLLFRGKREDNGKWVYGFYVCIGEKTHYILTGKLDLTKGHVEFETHRVDPNTIGQYINLTDENDEKIFEGDVVNFVTTAYTFKNCVVKYEKSYARFCVVDEHGYIYPMDESFIYQVVGNIYDKN